MSSHREAPEISKDPVADSSDVYAFRSPDKPDTVTLIANYVPLQGPAAGPNFFEFGDDVLYQIHIAWAGHTTPDITYSFRFTNEVRAPESFLYNNGPITGLRDANWNRRQLYTVSKTTRTGTTVLARGLASPPCNIGPRSTPDYPALAAKAVHTLPGGGKVFAGQRADAFFVDLGSVFDLLTLRPLQSAHLIPMGSTAGVNALANSNVHSIALQLPITEVLGGRALGAVSSTRSVIGVWTTASRARARVFDTRTQEYVNVGPWQQVSRLGNPLINEAVIPMGSKDRWNTQPPSKDKAFLKYYNRPEIAKLLPVLYPGAFPKLAAINADRADLAAILLTGIPKGLIPGFQNYTGATPADMLRLNLAVAPTNSPNKLGLIGGDAAGFPNGRRIVDDVVAIELRAIAGAVYGLIDPTFTPDTVVSSLADGSSGPAPLSAFPYLPTPYDGYSAGVA